MKVRSWDKEINCFVFFDCGRYFLQAKESFKIREKFLDLFFWKNAEQNTGLTDKQDKEIYEGDYFIHEGIKLVVKLLCGRFIVEYNDLEYELYGICKNYEIKGNIHEDN